MQQCLQSFFLLLKIQCNSLCIMTLTCPFLFLSSTSEFILTLRFSSVCGVCAGNKTLILWYVSFFVYVVILAIGIVCLNYSKLSYLFFMNILLSILLKLCTVLYILYVNFLAVHLQFFYKYRESVGDSFYYML